MKKLAEMKEKKDENVLEEGGFISKRCRLEKKEKDNVVEKPKAVLPSSGGLKRKTVADFWTDVESVLGKAHEVISIDELKPLTSKPSNELMSSYIHKVMQVLRESLYLSRKHLDYDEKNVLALSKDRLSMLEKDLKTKKAFCALKDKQLEHHPDIDLSKFDIEKEEREVVVDQAVAVNANDAIDEEIDASTDDLVDPAQP
nr:hypothetical protein CFP56_27552 [Quercus suber]